MIYNYQVSVFSIYYFEDRTYEDVWPQEVVKYMLPEDRDGQDKVARQKYDSIAGLVKSKWPKTTSKKSAKKATKKKDQSVRCNS